jgi:flagellar M-ring protein FliF
METSFMQSPFRSPVLLATGLIVIVGAMCAALWWVSGSRREVLFEHLPDTQLNSMATELDRAGINYAIDREKAAITVGEHDARAARLAIMASGNTLREAVGFELFDKSDFGMTDFAQKINYQRAVEGEIARTVGALADIKYTRVHLVLPEHSLFQREQQKPRASVTVFQNRSVTMPASEVKGIQRITASAVPDLDEQDVTVVNQNGVILSAPAQADGQPMNLSARLAQKRAMESYVAGKIHQLLLPALGSDHFAVSVDISLDPNQTTTTREKVLNAGANAGVKRLKESSNHNKGDNGNDDLQREVEYAVGHESEHVIRNSGEIRRIQVGVVIDSAIKDVDLDKLRELIATTAGIDNARGDRIAVVRRNLAATAPVAARASAAASPTIAPAEHAAVAPLRGWLIVALFAAGLAAGGGLVFLALRLNLPQRRTALRLRRELQQWIEAETIEADHS